jgi:hypothetical protein
MPPYQPTSDMKYNDVVRYPFLTCHDRILSGRKPAEAKLKGDCHLLR